MYYASNLALSESFVFACRPFYVTRNGKRYKFPCVSLVSRKTGRIQSVPGLEKYYIDFRFAYEMAEITLMKKGYAVTDFMNFLLLETNVFRFEDIDVDILRAFAEDYKTTDDDIPRDPDKWRRTIAVIYEMLDVYHKTYSKILDFKYNPKSFYKDSMRVPIDVDDVKYKLQKVVTFGVKPPVRKEKRLRFLVEGYLPILLEEARRYDPMIELAIALQAYAGLREGEIVNLQQKSLKSRDVGFGQVGKIVIDLLHHAPFAENYRGKTSFGRIKKPREQEVYIDFVDDITTLRSDHMRLLKHRDDDAPLFENRWGKPLTVTTYQLHVRQLFKNHFLPDLKKIVVEEGTWAENGPFIEAYEQQYPGCHMFRHWFTMYLLKRNLPPQEISYWRGDRNLESMADYIHVYGEMVDQYKKSSYEVQKKILEEVMK